MSDEAKALLGKWVEDKLTGFVGVCTCVCVHLTGSDRAGIESLDERGNIQTTWLDVERIKLKGAAE